MDTESIIADLEQERDRLTAAIQALSGSGTRRSAWASKWRIPSPGNFSAWAAIAPKGTEWSPPTTPTSLPRSSQRRVSPATHAFMRSEKDSVPFRDIFRKHFHVTTSGFFSDTALLCSVMEIGVDRIMFSVDYPFEAQPPAPRWLANIPLCDEDKAKIASGNARRLLKM